MFADATTDESLSFELMEYIPTPSLEEAARIHWGELAFFNQTEQDPTAAIVLHKPLNVSESAFRVRETELLKMTKSN